MEIIRVPVTVLQENVYFYYDKETLEGIIIDPGGEGQRLLQVIRDHGLLIKGILLTHGHFDHISAVEQIREATGAPVVANKKEKIVLTDGAVNMSFTMTGKSVALTTDVFLTDGETFCFADEVLQMLHTPGHTPGGACFYSQKANVVFSGDTLFYESIGRSDFAYGDGDILMASIKDKLLALPDETKVYPGHGQPTSIGYERKHNPYFGNSVF